MSSGNIEKIVLETDTPDTFIQKLKLENKLITNICQHVGSFTQQDPESLQSLVNKMEFSSCRRSDQDSSSQWDASLEPLMATHTNSRHAEKYKCSPVKLTHVFRDIHLNTNSLLYSNEQSHSKRKKRRSLSAIGETDEETHVKLNINKKLIEKKKDCIAELRYKHRCNIHKLVKIVMDNIKQNIFSISNRVSNYKINKYNMKYEEHVELALKYFLSENETLLWYICSTHIAEVSKKFGYFLDSLKFYTLSV